MLLRLWKLLEGKKAIMLKFLCSHERNTSSSHWNSEWRWDDLWTNWCECTGKLGFHAETSWSSVKVLGSGTRRLHFSSPHEFNQHFREPLNVLGLSQLETVPSKTAQFVFFISIMCFVLARLSQWFDTGYTGPV